LASRALAVIPARYGSSRFPGKPLAEIAGLPMILHVARRAAKIRGIDEVVVATDDRRIFDVVLEDGIAAEMTSGDHETGTSRVAEVARRRRFGIVLNIQGDEPLLPVAAVGRLVDHMRTSRRTMMATLASPHSGGEDAGRADVVKVAVDRNGDALYFSRSAIPHGSGSFLHHIGIYAFRRAFLIKYPSLPRGPFEKSERLEQLRALENGYRVHVISCRARSFGVDRPADIKRVEKRIGSG